MLLKENMRLKAFGIINVPLIAFASPVLESLSDSEAVVRVPLNWRTHRRDLGSMYLGALVIGADIASGIMAFQREAKSRNKYSIIFKKIESDFLKRPESDVTFRCKDGKIIDNLMAAAAKSGKRESADITVVATSPKTSGDEPVARFVLTLTVKLKGSKQ
jgi:hypothetical protein